MTSDEKTNTGQSLSQMPMFGGEFVKKKRAAAPAKKDVLINTSVRVFSPGTDVQPVRAVYEGPIVHQLWINGELDRIVLTGSASWMPSQLSLSVFVAAQREPGPLPWILATREVFERVRMQVAELPAAGMTHSELTTWRERYDFLLEWAACEGWLG